MERPPAERRGKRRTLEQRVGLAQARLQTDDEGTDALFTLGANLSLQGQQQEALEVLHRLTKLDPKYPGLWWLKARMFEHMMGEREAARSAVSRALKPEA